MLSGNINEVFCTKDDNYTTIRKDDFPLLEHVQADCVDDGIYNPWVICDCCTRCY